MSLFVNSVLGGFLGTLLCWSLIKLSPSPKQKKFFLKAMAPINILVAVLLNVVDVYGKFIAPLFA